MQYFEHPSPSSHYSPSSRRPFPQFSLSSWSVSVAVSPVSVVSVSAGSVGSVNLYSPKNYANGYGDISEQLGVDVCPAK